MKKIIAILLSMIACNVNAEVISVTGTSTPPQCKAGKPCDIYSHHEIQIINASLMPETYNYSYQLCIDGICDNAENTITVQPGKSWLNSRQSHLAVRIPEGKFVYYVRTACGKEKSVHDYTIKVK